VRAPLDSFKKNLARSIDGEVRFDRGTLAVYSTDASNYRQVPIGVVCPRHEGDVAAALAIARENSIPILARGGGTSLAGQCANAALVLDFTKYMRSIGRIDFEARTVEVEPGVVQAQLNAALAAYELFFAPDPSTKDRCTIGGMIGNNSCGAHSAAYGKTVDNLAALEVLLYDGTKLSLRGAMFDAELDTAIAGGGRAGELYDALRALRDRVGERVRSSYPKIPRRVSGYNLDELLSERGCNVARAACGSEGTLGVTLGATLMLAPRPQHLALAVLGFDDVFVAADQVPWLLAHRPEALEGFDDRLVGFGRKKGVEGIRHLPDGHAFLIVEVGGDTADIARGRAERLAADARRARECSAARVITSAVEQTAVWRLRESGLGAGAFIAGHPRTWPGAEDCAVPPAKLGEYLRGFDAILMRHALTAASYYGHFGEGCVHARVSFDLASRDGIATFRAAMTDLAALVVQLGGSLSGEHGDGLARSELLATMFPPDLIAAFGEFKRIFDPDARMNPGVIVAPQPLDSHLKLGASHRPRTVATHFDFSAEGGLAGAALKCVGIGKCRKTDAGTMCPSYMATRDEMHSTRGRARMLFEALNGDLPGGFGDPALKEALELCLSCKACKTECPASVDMAAYRAEYFANYYRRHARPLRARFFGRLHELARAASVAPAAANAIASAGAIASLGKRLLGIHPERDLPSLAPQTFRAWFARRASPLPRTEDGAREESGQHDVILFPDTFTNFFEPHIAIAATEVLERAGFRVAIPAGDLCCGRPLYDQGLLDRAKRRLDDAISLLAPSAARGIPIVGLEPSCILTFRDELPSLFPRDERARLLAVHAFTFDEFAAKHAGRLRLPNLGGRALLHGHCHLKSLVGLDHATAVLRRISDLHLDVLDSGCCGMAGAFGYEREHFEVSRAVGERVLLPTVRASPPETIIIADGFSCRSQIRQFCPVRRPMHLAEVLNL